MARLTPEQWQAIRTVWEYDPDEPSLDVAAGRAAAKYKFRPAGKSSIHDKSKKDGWERRGDMTGINQAAHRKADKLVDADGNRTPKTEQPNAKPNAKPDDVQKPNPAMAQAARVESEDKRAEVNARHRQEWGQIAMLRQEALAKRKDDPVRSSDMLRQCKMAAEITAIQQAGERKAWGMDVLIDPSTVRQMSTEQLEAIAAGKSI